MNMTARLTTLALGVAVAAGQAFAQPAGGPIDPGVWTAVGVNAMAPFHTPTIAPATVNLAEINAVLDPLNAAELLEVRQRCSVVVTDAARYGEPAVNFCNAVFAWVAANRPDAPTTDAALAAAAAL